MTFGISFTPVSWGPLAQWLTLVVSDLKKDLWARVGDPVKGPLFFLLCNRLGRLAGRFDALLARLEAGQPAAAPGPARTRPPRAPPKPDTLRLPQDRGWLFGMLPTMTAALHRIRLEALLADPQTAALLAAAPEAGRILRPLCHLLGVHPTGALVLPSQAGKPPPGPRFVKPPPPPPPLSAIAEVCRAIALQTPGAIWVTTNHPEPPEKPPRWSFER